VPSKSGKLPTRGLKKRYNYVEGWCKEKKEYLLIFVEEYFPRHQKNYNGV